MLWNAMKEGLEQMVKKETWSQYLELFLIKGDSQAYAEAEPQTYGLVLV